MSVWMRPQSVFSAAVLLSSRKVLVLEDPRGPVFKSSSLELKSLSLSSDYKSLSLSSSSEVQVLENGVSGGSCDVTSVWLVLWQLCISRRPGRLFETRCLQCCCPRGKSRPCPRPWTSSPCPFPHPWVSSPWQQHCSAGSRCDDAMLQQSAVVPSLSHIIYWCRPSVDKLAAWHCLLHGITYCIPLFHSFIGITNWQYVVL